MKIYDIKVRKVLNSRAEFTSEVVIFTNKGIASAILPAGKSTGKKEAVRYDVNETLKFVDEFKKLLIDRDFDSFQELDRYLIEIAGENKARFGVDLILGTSIAALRLFGYDKIELFLEREPKLPTPMLNLINGGKHAASNIDFQEFLIVPNKFNSFKEKIEAAVEIYRQLKKNIEEKYGKENTNIGDEGGYVLIDKKLTNEAALEILSNTIEELGYNNKVKISLDCAANSYYINEKYKINNNLLDKEEYLEYLVDLVKKYDIFSIEDPFDEEDPELYAELNKKVDVVGDDLTVTNALNIDRYKDAISGVIIKPNQIGTVLETLEAIARAKSYNIFTIVSHRSGDTEDVFIADLAYHAGAEFIKTGAPARGERTSKYNQLLRIEGD